MSSPNAPFEAPPSQSSDAPPEASTPPATNPFAAPSPGESQHSGSKHLHVDEAEIPTVDSVAAADERVQRGGRPARVGGQGNPNQGGQGNRGGRNRRSRSGRSRG